MDSVLLRICADKREEVARSRATQPRPDVSAASPPRAVEFGDFGIIAEVKRASPSAGTIAGGADAVAQARAYAGAGAAAVSVLTDARHFGGSLDDLVAVRRVVDVPLLRKDFVVDPYQVVEARAAGADIVLLIVAALDPAALADLADMVRDLGMTPLVEVLGPDEVDAALEAVSVGGLFGVNSRNLHTLDVDLATWDAVADLIPPDVVAVAESGVRTTADAARARHLGYRAILCGETLMRAGDPAAAIRELTSAGVDA